MTNFAFQREAVQNAFAAFLEGFCYNANQIRFVRQIVIYLTQNATMEPGQLHEQPFTFLSASGIDGVFGEEDAEQLLVVVIGFAQNAGLQN